MANYYADLIVMTRPFLPLTSSPDILILTQINLTPHA